MSGRAAVPGLRTPHPLGARLPDVYAGEDFTQRFLGAFDDVLAPVFAVLDSMEAYWDPRLAPADFVEWLADWVAAPEPAEGPDQERRRRAAVADAVRTHRARGTLAGLADQLRQLGVHAEIGDSGGATWSATPNGPLPGSDLPTLLIRIRDTGLDGAALRRIELAVERDRPAHVRCRIEVVP
ncbi:phage tail protein [Kitasatospora sp. NPDC058965]|uniref:phage tail protein n=1 Tax=Kitasatospora sp. NPDC058965 TaxID=3346682 RepID=UPI0036CE4650